MTSSRPVAGAPAPESGFGATAQGRVVALVFLAASAQCALMARLGQPQFPIHRYPQIVTAVVGIGTAVGLWAWRERDRIDQGRMNALVLLWTALFATFLGAVLPPGSSISGEWAALCPIMLATVFLSSRTLAAAQVLVAVAVMAGIIVSRLDGDGTVALVAAIELWVAVVVAVVIRVLREVAVAALNRASRGELTDPLTGLSNRRGLERAAPALWAARGAAHEPVALLVVDVDHFKRINDTSGHAAGDEVLRSISAFLASSLRQTDVAVRLGGEEFLVLLGGAPAGKAPQIAERLRVGIARAVPGVTVSIGVAETVPDPTDPLPAALWTAVDTADHALYEAKRSGRNRVVTA